VTAAKNRGFQAGFGIAFPFVFTFYLALSLLEDSGYMTRAAVLAGTANLGEVMSGIQLYTFAIISVLFIPCISTIAVLYQKLGARIAILASVYSVALGFFIGALINLLMK
jgi:ferrous iron transport protein B